MKHSTIIIPSIASYINKWKNVSSIANGHQYNAKESFVIIIKGSAIDWHLYSDMLAIYGSNTLRQIPNLIEILGNIFRIFFVVLGGCTYCSLRQSQMAKHVLFIILLIVNLAIRNEKLRDCWLPP